MNLSKVKISSTFALYNYFIAIIFVFNCFGAFEMKIKANSIDSLLHVYSKSTSENKGQILNKIATLYTLENRDTNLNLTAEYIGFQNLDAQSKADLYLLLGDKYIIAQQISKSYFYLQKSLEIFQSVDNQIGIAKAKSALALVLTKLSDFELAIGLLLDALPVFQEFNQFALEGDVWVKLANIFYEIDEFEEAKLNYENALKIWQQLADSNKIANVYFNIGRVYFKLGSNSKAFQFNEKSLIINESTGKTEDIILSYFFSGELFEKQNDYLKAETSYLKALELSKTIANRYYIAKAYNDLAKIYILTSDLNKARTYLTEAMIAAEFINSTEILIEVYKNLSSLYEQEGIFDKALVYYKEYTRLKESLFSEKKYHKISQSKLNLDNQSKSKIIKSLEEDSFYKTKSLKKQRYFLIVSLFAGFLFFMLVVLIYKQSRRRRILNEELQKQKNKAEEADLLKSAFLANMSHEIRSPMNAIIGFSNLISDSFELEEEMAKFLSYIKLSGANLLQLVDDIIDIAKIEAGQLKIRKENFDLDEMLAKLMMTIGAGTMNKSATTTIQLKIPSNSDKPIIFSDELRIKQVLTNFISNAVKFTDKGIIEFGYEKLPNSEILFYTRDSGLGISDKDKELIFQRFGQVEDSYTRNTSGTGLGLAISKSIVELLNGEIWVDSIENKGSTFYFKIPVLFKGNSAEHELPQIPHLNNLNWQDKTILVVEDDEMNFKVIQAILAKTNIQITRVFNGQESIDAVFSEAELNLVLMDIQLPVLNGYQAVKSIRIKSSIPVIAVTAYAMPGEKEKCIEAGCNDYISKPYNIEELLNKIAKLIL